MNRKRKLKILHVLSQRPDSTGSGIFVQAMLRGAQAHGDENFLVAGLDRPPGTLPGGITPDSSLFVDFETDDLPFKIPGMSDVMPYDSSRFRDLSEDMIAAYEEAFAGTLNRAVDRFRPDVIHSHHLWIVSSLTRRLFPGIPMVTSCHGSDLRQFQNCAHLRSRVVEGCRKIDRVMALSDSQKSDISELHGILPERVVTAGAGFDDQLFHGGVKPDAEPVQVVYAGKLSNAKGVPWLLRALGRLETPAWQLHLLGGGSGEEKESCLDLARALGDRVTIHGAVPQTRLAGIMRSSHVLVLPSFFEGLPLVLLEALASGCRIVATDLPGVKEVLGRSAVDFISLVPTPRLRDIDQPLEEDEESFEQDLGAALRQQITAANLGHPMDMSLIQDTLDSYTWRGVFSKYRQVYLDCL